MFLRPVQDWLGRPYPFNNEWRASIVNAIWSGVFVMSLLFILRPFGTTVPAGAELHYFIRCMQFGLVTAAIVLITNGLTRMLPRIFEEEKWTVGKEIVFTLSFISLIGIGNLLLAALLWNESFTFRTFWIWQGLTFAIGIFPTLLGAFISQAKLSKRYATEAALISPKHHAAPAKDEQMIVLEGENQNERLPLMPAQLVYIAAADNYVQVFFLENNRLKNQMLRATMKKMEDTLLEHPQFFRCHRTYLVNMNMVKMVTGNAQGYRLQLDGVDDTVPVSRGLNNTVQQML